MLIDKSTHRQLCWQCGKHLDNRSHVKRDYYGEKILLHHCCATQFDKDQQQSKITAQPGDSAGKKSGAE